jgi:hypothetical protein
MIERGRKFVRVGCCYRRDRVSWLGLWSVTSCGCRMPGTQALAQMQGGG